MTAAVYAREIREQFDCGQCAANGAEWERLGKCLGPILENGEPAAVALRMDHERYGTAEYPETFETCPMGLLRADLRPREVAIAGLVSHAAAADVDKRWPDLPARLSSLVVRWRVTESQKLRAEHEASMKTLGARRGS